MFRHLFPPDPVSRPATSRLGVQLLEARDVPAGYWWSPMGTADFYDPGDWMKGPGVPWDRYTYSDPAPNPTSDLYFVGGVSNADCVIPVQPAVSGNTFNGLHLNFGQGPVVVDEEGNPITTPPPAYTGTVITSNSFAVGTLDVDCGAISQGSITVTSGNGTALTVTSLLDWTGGTLNSNTVAGTIALAPGATGVAEPSFTNPGINGTVRLGSILTLLGNETTETGSTLSIRGGTVKMPRGHIEAGAFCTLNLIALKGNAADPVSKLTIDGEENNEAKVKVKPKSKAVVTTIRAADDNDGSSSVNVGDLKGGDFENSGATEITNKTDLIVMSTLNDTAGHYTQKAVVANGQVVAIPTTTLETGSGVTCGSNGLQGHVGSFVVEAGTLDIKNRKKNGEPTADLTATINAQAVAVWSDATINMLGARYNTLDIVGKFAYMGGIFMAISASTDEADLIRVTGKVEVTKTTAKLKFYWGDPNANLKLYQRDWVLIKSTGDTINNELDSTRIDVSALDSRIHAEDVSRTADHEELCLHPYILPYV